MKGVGLREASETARPATAKIGVFSLKVIVYGRKGVNSIEKISPLLVISYQLSVVSGGGSLEVVRKNSGRRLAVNCQKDRSQTDSLWYSR